MTIHDTAALPAASNRIAQGRAEPAIQIRITVEVLVYAALALLALALRVAQVGAHPLDDAESRQALAALRAINTQAPGDALVPDSPLTFALDAVAFTILTPGNAAARLPVALAGVLLVLAPALWRRYLNPLPPLITSGLLAISPVAVLASRTTSPAVWTMLGAVVVPWLALRFVETRARRWAMLATVGAAAMVLLAEPAGFLALLALGVGVLFAWLTDDGEAQVPARLREIGRVWPWADSVVAAGVVVVVVSTGFFFLPSGLTAVGGVVWDGLRGFVDRQAGAPVAFPLLISLRYETGLLLVGLLACYRVVRDGGFFERALAGWFLGGVVWAMGYAGATAGHALWLTVPLCVLVGLTVTHWISERTEFVWRVPAWGISLHAVVTFALWMAVGMSIVLLGKRLLEDVPGGITLRLLVDTLVQGIYSRNSDQPEWIPLTETVGVWDYVLGYIQLRLLLTILISLLTGVLYFLVGSLWGARAAWRGMALGSLAFMVLFSFGLGGRAALGSPGDPREYWYANPVTNDIQELRATLREMSLRDTGDPRLITITAWTPDDGALAWALRDYPNTVFVDGVGPEVNTAAVIMPQIIPPLRMGADYVGKDLVVRQAWDINTLSWKDALMWFYKSDSALAPAPKETDMIWIRKDVYGVEQVTED